MRKAREINDTATIKVYYSRKKSNTACTNVQSIYDFFVSNDASTECPGKKQGRFYGGQQRQMRYLKDDLKQLHKLFLVKSAKVVSYLTFL